MMTIILENLIAVSVVIIVIPSLVSTVFRLLLYQYLRGLAREVQRLIQNQSQGLQTNKVISTLERRFKLASNQLDQVNTSALIDQVYSQQKLKGLSLDQIDYFCRIIPNLLLAFGLIGTFVGITFNLYTLSQTLNQTNAADINALVEDLKQPLAGIDKLEHNIIDKAESLQVIAVSLSDLKTMIDYQTASINSTFTNVSQDIIDKAESLQVIAVNLAELKTIIDHQAASIDSAFTNMSEQFDGNHKNLLQIIASGNSNLTKEYHNIGNVLLKGMSKQTTVNQENLQKINKNLQLCIQYLNETKYEVNQWRRTKNTLQSQPQDPVKDGFTHT